MAVTVSTGVVTAVFSAKVVSAVEVNEGAFALCAIAVLPVRYRAKLTANRHR